MIRVTAPTVTATHSGIGALDVKDATVTLDESVSPYVQATLTCASPGGGQVELIDPRVGQRVTVVLDDRASLFGGTSTTRTLDLYLSARDHDPAGGELTLELASDEALLLDQALLLKNVRNWAKITARTLVNAVLADRGLGALAAGGPEVNIDPAAAVQSPGQSYLEFLLGTLEAANLRLWCDESRGWHLTDKGDLTAGQLNLAYNGTVTGLADRVALEGDYYDGVVIRYSYLDTSGNAQTAYDYATSGGTPRRVARVDYTSGPAVTGGAARLLRRMRGRGRDLAPEAVNRFDVTPAQPVVVTLPDGAPVQSGKVRSVTWRMPSDRMSIATRELTDTTTGMWAAVAVGTRWQDIPAGVTWGNFGGIRWDAVAVGTGWDDLAEGVRWSEYGQAT